MTSELSLDLKSINKLDANNYFRQYNLCKEFYDNPGREHYKLLSYLSTLFNNTHIIEIGTHLGDSAVALSYNKTNVLYTFDIIDKVSQEKKQIDNVKFIIDDVMTNIETREKWKDILLSSAFIFLDVDPHNGYMEYDFYLFLKENNYSGILICDDINYFQGMRENFWWKIDDQCKSDITHLGHWSGTGLVSFAELNTNI